MNWYLLILFAAVFIGLMEVVQKKALIKEYAAAFLSASSLVVVLMSLPILLTGNIRMVDGMTLVLVLIDSLLATFMFILTARALRHLDISEFAPLMNFSPVFLLVLSIFFLGEKIVPMQLSGIALIIFGAYILELKQGWTYPLRRIKENKYIHYIFFAMIFASSAAVMDKFILSRPNINVETFYLLQRIFIAFMLFIRTTFIYEGYKDIMVVYKKSFLWILVFSILYIAGNYLYLMAVAVPAALISLIIPVKRTSTLIATVVGGEFFGERNIFRKSFACIVMIVGVVLIVL